LSEQRRKRNDDPVPLDYRSILNLIVEENGPLCHGLAKSATTAEGNDVVRVLATSVLRESGPHGEAVYRGESTGPEVFNRLSAREFAAIRLLDYVDHAGRQFPDPNSADGTVLSDPIQLLREAIITGESEAEAPFFLDWLHLLRQTREEVTQLPASLSTIDRWMGRHPVGTSSAVVAARKENRERIMNILLDRIDAGKIVRKRFTFDEGMSREEKLARMRVWWQDHRFHLSFAVRRPRLLNQMLDYSLSPETLSIMKRAHSAGIPIFVNPYYLSLLLVRPSRKLEGADLAIRQYVLYNADLLSAFGTIAAWEKEDEVERGKPNAAGWLLPARHAVHRRYPEVAILIPETTGRACAGLCASCQRMYDFQSGHLNFELDKLEPTEPWPRRLRRFLDYFESDSQLRDILITGGDALMSSDTSLRRILKAVLQMAERKREANLSRPEGEKYAEMVRIRLGTRLPVYLPQRVTDSLVKVLADFRARATKAGFKQFVIQTHFQSAMEMTPEAALALRRLIDAGWSVTNQLVFTSGASRRGHTAKLRKVLNDAGVLPYYTFAVKGHGENRGHFAPLARVVQEQLEEKHAGMIPAEWYDELRSFTDDPVHSRDTINRVREAAGIPFLATDRNVLNLPGVGKSLTFRTVGLTSDGRRVHRFDHDHNRRHSPIIDQMGMVPIVESKSISDYLQQLAEMGERTVDYRTIWGFSMGETEPRLPSFEYPPYPFTTTDDLTNLDVEGALEE
jgi:lysine 2,3-aminomutase